MSAAFGAVVVTYNSAEVVGECLDALLGLPVVVVDNASGDGTLEEVRQRTWARLIANPENRGFAAAVNQGFAASETECVLVLNPDVVVLGGFKELEEACRASGIAAGKLVDASGRAQVGFTIRRFPTAWTLIFEAWGWNRLWPGNPVNRRYRYLDRELQEPGEVEQPAGAFLAIHRDVWTRTGGFDERFFPVWSEDVDFLKRAAEMGFRCRYVPGAAGYHRGAHSVNRLPERQRRLYWYGNLLGYASKHFRRLSYRAVCGAVVCGSVPRMLVVTVMQRGLEPVAAYGEVIRFAGARLFFGDWSGCNTLFRKMKE